MIGRDDNHRHAMKRETASRIVLTIFFVFSFVFFINNTAAAQVAGQSGYSLVGTIQSRDFTGAVINVSKNEQTFLRLGDKLPDGSQVVKVTPDSIVLKAADGTTSEMFVLHETKTVASVQPGVLVDPYAGGVRKPPEERPLREYEKRRQMRLKGRQDDE